MIQMACHTQLLAQSSALKIQIQPASVTGSKGPPKKKKSAQKQEKAVQNILSKEGNTTFQPSSQVPAIFRRGLKREYGAVDRDLWLWYCSACKRLGGKKISKQLVQARAKWAFHRAGITNFKASDGWYKRWTKRWKYFSPVIPDIPVEDTWDFLGSNTGQPADSLEIFQEVVTKEVKQEIQEQVQQIGKLLSSKPLKYVGDKSAQALLETGVSENTQANIKQETISTKAIREIESTSGEVPSEVNSQDANSNTKNCTVDVELRNHDSIIRQTINEEQTLSKNSKNIEIKLLNLNDVNFATNEVSENLLQFSGIIELMPQELTNHVDFVVTCEKDSSAKPSMDESSENNSCGSTSIQFSADKLKDFANFFFPKCNDKSSSSEIATLTFSCESPTPLSEKVGKENNISILPASSTKNSAVTDSSSEPNMSTGKRKDKVPIEQNETSEKTAKESTQQDSFSRIQDGKPQNLNSTTKSSVVSKIELYKNGKRYLPHFKDKVLSYVSNHTLKDTAKKFKVDLGSIMRWKKDKAREKLMSRRAAEKSKVSSILSIDEQFLTWLRQQRGREFTGSEVQDYARQLVIQYGGQAAVERQSRWFAMWVHRFKEKPYHEGMEYMKHREEELRILYPPAFRVEVAAFADKYTQMKAARIFHVSRKRVFDWLKMFREKRDKEVSNVQSASRQNSGRTVTDRDIDQQIWTWYKTCLAEGRKPKGSEVRNKGLALFQERGYSGIICSHGWYKRWCDRFGVLLQHGGDDEMLEWTLTQLDCNRSLTHHDLQEQARSMRSKNIPEFKASSGWAIRFCRRHPKLLQQIPNIETPLPGILQRKVESFRSKIQDLIKEKAYSFHAIGSMDEVPFHFSAPVFSSSKRHLLLRKPGTEDCHATIVLACLADGRMLPPAVIFKDCLGSQAMDDENGDLLVLRQEEGLLDDQCMKQWLEQVWFKYVPTPNLLIVDCYGPHSTDSVQERFSGCGSELVIIPGGCTSKLQPLDVSIKGIFQMGIEKQWTESDSQPASTIGTWGSTSKFHLPTSIELVRWVRDTYLHIQTNKQETIRRSFLVTGLTVSSNHTEDHFIENLSLMPSNKDSHYVLGL